MRLHHLGYVGRDLETLQRRFGKEASEMITGPIPDPIQRVVVQFYRDAVTGDVAEIIVPLETIETSPLAGRIARGGGLDHACYELEAGDGTLEEVLDAERARGARVTCPPVPSTAFARRIAFVLLRSGRLIEYVEARGPGQVI